jgi:hypothetical protein
VLGHVAVAHPVEVPGRERTVAAQREEPGEAGERGERLGRTIREAARGTRPRIGRRHGATQ